MSAFRSYCRLVAWDWVREMKRKDTITSMVLFSMVTLFIFSRAIPADTRASIDWRAGILWVTYLLAAAIGIDRAFRGSGGRRALEGVLLSPVGRVTFYYAKVTSTLLYVLMMEVMIFAVFCVLYNVDVTLAQVGKIALVTLGTSVGFVAVGVILSAMMMSIHGGDVLLRILLFAFLIPILWAAVDITGAIFREEAVNLFQLTVVGTFDVAYLMAGQMLIEPVLRDYDG